MTTRGSVVGPLVAQLFEGFRRKKFPVAVTKRGADRGRSQEARMHRFKIVALMIVLFVFTAAPGGGRSIRLRAGLNPSVRAETLSKAKLGPWNSSGWKVQFRKQHVALSPYFGEFVIPPFRPPKGNFFARPVDLFTAFGGLCRGGPCAFPRVALMKFKLREMEKHLRDYVAQHATVVFDAWLSAFVLSQAKEAARRKASHSDPANADDLAVSICLKFLRLDGSGEPLPFGADRNGKAYFGKVAGRELVDSWRSATRPFNPADPWFREPAKPIVGFDSEKEGPPLKRRQQRIPKADVTDTGELPERDLEDSIEKRVQVRAAIEAIPSGLLREIALHLQNGLTQREIGDMYGMSVKWANSRVAELRLYFSNAVGKR